MAEESKQDPKSDQLYDLAVTHKCARCGCSVAITDARVLAAAMTFAMLRLTCPRCSHQNDYAPRRKPSDMRRAHTATELSRGQRQKLERNPIIIPGGR